MQTKKHQQFPISGPTNTHSLSYSHAFSSKASHWPSDHMTSSRILNAWLTQELFMEGYSSLRRYALRYAITTVKIYILKYISYTIYNSKFHIYPRYIREISILALVNMPQATKCPIQKSQNVNKIAKKNLSSFL